MKRLKKVSISDDERWGEYDALKKMGDAIKANKLKEQILSSHRWKKPCHHVKSY
jgi:hypothetical protein